MRVFITGIAGFLGSHLADSFLRAGNLVRGVDNLSGGEELNVPPGASWLIADCQDIAKYESLLQGSDVLYHCAALPHEGLSVFSPRLITESIYGASVAVFTAAIRAGVKRIVFCSSMSRYGSGLPPFGELQEPAPVDPYGIAKVAAEQTLVALSRAHGFEYVIAVPHNIIGPRQKYNDPYRNVAAIMLNRVLQGKRIIIYGDGSQERCFSDIRDVVPTLQLLAIANVQGQVFNVGPDEGIVSIEQLAKLVCEVTTSPFDPLYLPARPLEVRQAFCSSDKIRLCFNYKTQYTLRETLQSLDAWIRKLGTRPFRWHLPVEIQSSSTPKPFLSHDFDEEAEDVASA